MLAPFLQLLFGTEKLITAMPVASDAGLSAGTILNYLKYFISSIIIEEGTVYALGAICGIIITAIFFKNLFTYLSY